MTIAIAGQSSVKAAAGPPQVGHIQRPARRREGTGHIARTEHIGATASSPTIVFRTPSGMVVHARCRSPLEFQGRRRAEFELDFYCRRCVEHVPLPECVLSRIPLAVFGSEDRP